jgi:hypothetical protein
MNHGVVAVNSSRKRTGQEHGDSIATVTPKS